MTNYTTAELHTRVGSALLAFFCKDRDLLCLDAHEKSITHKLAEHLQRQFDCLKADCEYNRYDDDADKIKRPPSKDGIASTDCSKGNTIYPDIVVHKRASKSDNKIVIEVKKSNNKRNVRSDKKRLRKFTKTGYGYEYDLGLFLEFGVGEQSGLNHVECYQDGEIQTCCDCKRLKKVFCRSAIKARMKDADKCCVLED